ncbi:unnamed protein product [Bubo scandiacus]
MSSLAALREGYERFDPHAYLQNNYLPPRADFSSEEFVVPWKLRCLAETFASGEIRGHTLIDVGSGPTIYQLLSACDHFEEIVATDYLAVNRGGAGALGAGGARHLRLDPLHPPRLQDRGTRGALAGEGAAAAGPAAADPAHRPGAARLPVVPLAEDDVRAALAGAGFTLRALRSYAMPPALRTGVDDVDGVFFAHAQKPLEA